MDFAVCHFFFCREFKFQIPYNAKLINDVTKYLAKSNRKLEKQFFFWVRCEKFD